MDDFESKRVEDCLDGSRAYDYYEADVAENGVTIWPSAYMIRGVSGAFMDLAYGNPYPNGLYTSSANRSKGSNVATAMVSSS
jgi:hypothetical protein